METIAIATPWRPVTEMSVERIGLVRVFGRGSTAVG
jgi:hypothetical protein